MDRKKSSVSEVREDERNNERGAGKDGRNKIRLALQVMNKIFYLQWEFIGVF